MTKIGAIILAAGFSRRMGKPKLLMPYLEKALISYPVSKVIQSELSPIIFVSGIYDEQLQKVLRPFKEQIIFVKNELAKEGMSTSLIKGIEMIEPHVDACIVFLGDQPFVSDEVIAKLIQVYEENYQQGIKIVRPRYNNLPGHPILIDKSLFVQFKQLNGDQGGKMILNQYKDSLMYVDFENPLWGLDIDTPEDYLNLIKN